MNKVRIQLLNEEDSSKVYSLIEESRSELRNLIWSKEATLESTLKFIKDKIEIEDKIFGIFHYGNLAGVLELRKKETFLELGYWLGTKYRGKGLLKEAVKKLVDDNIQSNAIIAHIRVKNKASFKVLEYAGLKYDHTEIWENEEWIHLKRECEKP